MLLTWYIVFDFHPKWKKPKLQISERITALYTREWKTHICFFFVVVFLRHRKTETEYGLWKESHRILCFVNHQHKPHVNTKESNSIFQSLSNAQITPAQKQKEGKKECYWEKWREETKKERKRNLLMTYIHIYNTIYNKLDFYCIFYDIFLTYPSK